MKACKEFEARISALIDDELSPEERAAVLEHIADCPACKAYWEDLLTIGDILRAEDTAAPEGFAESVMARVKETRQEKKVITFPLWKRFAAIAACCAIAVLGVWMMGGVPNYMEDAAVSNSGAPESLPMQADAAKSGEMPETDGGWSYGNFGNNEPCDTAPGGVVDDAECDASDEAAASVIATASDAAAEWVEDNLGENWVSGASYSLSEEQYNEVRAMLEKAGEPFSEIVGNETDGGYQLLAE